MFTPPARAQSAADKGAAATLPIPPPAQAAAAPREELSTEPVTPEPLTEPPEPVERKSLVPPIALGALAAASLGAGVALVVASGSKRAEAIDLDRAISEGGGSCVAALVDPRCAQRKSTAQRADTLRTTSVGAFVGAGLFATSVVVYILWPMPKASSGTMTTLRAAPVIGAGHGGVVLSGAF